MQGQQRASQVRLGPGHGGVSSAVGATRLPLSSGPSPWSLPPAPGLTPSFLWGEAGGRGCRAPVCLWVPDVEGPFPGWSSVPPSFVSFFCLLYFVLPLFEDNGLLFWVPYVLCRHSEVVLWNLLSV